MTICATVFNDRQRTFPAPGSRPVPRTNAADRFKGNDEPPLQELLADPIFERLFRSDRLTASHVETLARATRQGLTRRPL